MEKPSFVQEIRSLQGRMKNKRELFALTGLDVFQIKEAAFRPVFLPSVPAPRAGTVRLPF
jgi:hypothetical protein